MLRENARGAIHFPWDSLPIVATGLWGRGRTSETLHPAREPGRTRRVLPLVAVFASGALRREVLWDHVFKTMRQWHRLHQGCLRGTERPQRWGGGPRH